MKTAIKVTRVKKLEDEKIVEDYLHIEVGDSYARSTTLTMQEAEELFTKLKEKLDK